MKNFDDKQTLRNAIEKALESRTSGSGVSGASIVDHSYEDSRYHRTFSEVRKRPRSRDSEKDSRRTRAKKRREREDTPDEAEEERDRSTRREAHRERSRSPHRSTFRELHEPRFTRQVRFDRSRRVVPPRPRNFRFTNDRFPKRKFCRDFSQQGVCYRGASCPYIHESPIIVDSQASLEHLRGIPNGQKAEDLEISFGGQSFYPQNHLYGSFKENLKLPINGGGLGWAPPNFSIVSSGIRNPLDLNPPRVNDHSSGGISSEILLGDGESDRRESIWRERRNDQRKDRQWKERRSEDDNNATLTIAHIPFALNSIDRLSSHFKKYGQLINIQINKKDQKAVVQFSSHAQALKALKSPDAVLGNRFIKVYWAREAEKSQIKDDFTVPLTQISELNETKSVPDNQVQNKLDQIKAEKAERVKQLQQTSKNLSQLTRESVKKQQEIIDSLIQMSKKEGLAKEDRQEIFHKIETITNQVKETVSNAQRTFAKQKSILPSRPSIIPSIQQAKKPPPALAKSWKNAREEKFREKLDRELDLIATRKAIELSKKETDTDEKRTEEAMVIEPPSARPSNTDKPWSRGRGRSTSSRSFRRTNFSSHVLDNRTTSFVIHDVPLEHLDVEKLKQHFSSFGEVKEVSLYGSDAVIKMDTRWNAEKAIKHGNTLDVKELAINWYTVKDVTDTAPPRDVSGLDSLGRDENEETFKVEEFLPAGALNNQYDDDSEEDDEMERKRF